MDRNAVAQMTETIRQSNDFPQAANRIAQKFGGRGKVPPVVEEVLDGLGQLERETQGQAIDDDLYQNLIDRHIPFEGDLHNAMWELRKNAQRSGTQVFSGEGQAEGDTEVYDSSTGSSGNTEVFDKSTASSGNTEVYNPESDAEEEGDTEVYRR